MTTPKIQPTSPGEDLMRMLAEHQIEFERREIPFTDIDIEGSKNNQARFLPLHDDVVLTYGAAMEQGDIFPPIIATGAKGKYLILDGNHRVAAAILAEFERADAFLAKNITKAQAELLTFEANARHGLPTSVEERVQQGVYLVNVGNQPKAVARVLAIPERKLYSALQSYRTVQRLAKLGFDVKRFTNVAVVQRLGSLASNTLLKPAADLVIAAHLNTDETNEMVSEVNRHSDDGEAAQLRIVDTYRERYRAQIKSTSAGRMPIPVNVTRVKLAARMVKHIDQVELAKQLAALDPAIGQVARREVFEMIAHLVSVSESIKE